MSSKSEEELAASGVPVRTIHQTYQESLQARGEYQRAIGTQMEGWAHQNLHDAVMDFFEVLRPLLSSMNATEKLWNETKLWPVEPIMEAIAYCPHCGGNELVDELDDAPIEVGKPCPTCGQADVDTTHRPKVDEEGVVVYEWVEGLKSIDDLRNQRFEQEHTYQDALGTHTTTQTTSNLLAPEQLTAIARVLDEAMKELKLHATVDDKLPKGQVTNRWDP